ncbi:MAG: hypothetical protein ACON3Z_02225 [Bradymonadia bacterium]
MRTIFFSVVILLASTAVATPRLGADLHLGALGTLEADAEAAGATQHDAEATYVLAPWIESYVFGPIRVGAEFDLIWIKGGTQNHARRLIVAPQARLRYQRPLTKSYGFDAAFSLGPSWWTRSTEAGAGVAGTANRIGWGMRLAVGATYDLSPQVEIGANLGYLLNSSYGNRLTKTIDTLTFGLNIGTSY